MSENVQRIFPDAVDGSEHASLTDRLPRVSLKTVIKAAAGLSLGAGLTTLVLETERQRREIARLSEGQEATVAFVKAMVDQTNCGEEAYLYLQLQAEEEEKKDEVTTWSEEDTDPVPFEVTDEGVKALVESMMEDNS